MQVAPLSTGVRHIVLSAIRERAAWATQSSMARRMSRTSSYYTSAGMPNLEQKQASGGLAGAAASAHRFLSRCALVRNPYKFYRAAVSQILTGAQAFVAALHTANCSGLQGLGPWQRSCRSAWRFKCLKWVATNLAQRPKRPCKKPATNKT